MSRVVVACGGSSLERNISLDSGRRAARALRDRGHEVERLDANAGFLDVLEELRPAFVFVAMHGLGGEDGSIQDVLDILGVPYTGSDATASALCLDKHLLKSLCARQGIPTPAWHSFTKRAFHDYGAARVIPRLLGAFPDGLVVKPSQQGSSLGISIVRAEEDLRAAILEAMSYDDRVLLERHVPGRELAVTVMGEGETAEALPIVELRFEGEIYDYAAHYNIGSARVVAAELEPAIEERVRGVALDAYRAAGCRDFARVDLRLDGATPYVLEINTIPGLTETGPAPVAAGLAGLSFEDFVDRICARVRAG
jgi:D-alanine-D-alanine ligase